MSEQLGRTLKILVGKPGLDGHSNGAEQIAVRARDAGMEVVYEGIRLTPSQIARSAVDEGVHVIGLSILSGSHRELIPDVIEALREAGGGDIPLVVGGIIPDADVAPLRAAGVAAVYTPKDFELTRILRDVVGDRGGAERHRVRRGVSGAELGRAAARARPDRRPGGAEPASRTASAGGAAGDRRAARRGLARRARRRGARARRRGHRAAGRGQVDAAERARRAAGAAPGGSVAVLAVDPSSKRWAARCSATARGSTPTPPTAASSSARWPPGERLGGLAPATRAAAQALAAAFDVVVIETVGVGQSETEVAEAADTVAVIVQPGSGDALQFLKAGIMEVPDVLVVTKADLGAVATRAVRDLRAALRSLGERARPCSPSRACTR